MRSINSNNITEQKFEGFIFLRAIFSVLVVGLHANLFNLLSGKFNLDYLADIWNANIAYVAVPVFFQISLFLFYIKSEKIGHDYFTQKRLPKLISLYFFWVILKLVFDAAFTRNLGAIKLKFLSFGKLTEFIVSGGYTIYFFFFSLIFLTTLTEIIISRFRKSNETSKKERVSYYLLFFSSILVSSFPIIDITLIHNELLTRVINPLSFLPYVFTTIISVQEFKEKKLRKITPSLKLKLFILLALYLVFTVIEWILFKDFSLYSRYFPNYSKLSLVFLSWLLLYLALLSTQKVPTIVKFISGCSLGIYGFHIFFIEHTNFLNSLSLVIPGLGTLTQFLVALIGSIFLTLIFRKNKILRNFV